MSRTISIEELNKRIDKLILDYQSDLAEYLQYIDDVEEERKIQGKIQALLELKIELNDPQPIGDISENIQQTVAVIEANKIINDNPDKDEL